VRGFANFVSRSFQQRAQKPPDVVVVVHDEDPGSRHRISFHRGMQESCASFDASRVTASTAELSARFARAHTEVRTNAQPPAHAVPFTLIAVATAYGLLFLPTGQVDYAKASAAGVFGAALIGLALCWSRFPRFATLGIPIGYIVLAALLREAAGGSQSGF